MLKRFFVVIFILVQLISFIPATADTDITAEASELVLTGDTAYFSGGYAVLYKNDCALFDTEIMQNGYFRFNLHGSFSKGTIINLTVNNRPVDNIYVQEQTEFLIFFADLPKGNVSIALNVAVGNVQISRIELALSDKKLADEIVKSINAAGFYSQIKTAFENYSDGLSVNMSMLEKDIFYPDCAYGRLIGKDYKNINRVLEDAIASLIMEKAIPSVKLLKDTRTLSSFESSALELQISSSVRDVGVTIAAIYKGDGSLYKALLFDDNEFGDIECTLDLSGESDAESFTFKLFYWNNIETLTPINRFGEIYSHIWISPDGNDSNSGKSLESAFASMHRAKEEIETIADRMKGDIVVHISSGEYFLSSVEEFTESHSGKNGFNVIFRGEGSTRPVFTGGKKISGWKEHSNGIYKAPFDGKTSLRELWVNGFPAVRARGDYIYQYSEDNNDTTQKSFWVNDYAFPKLTNFDETELVWESMWTSRRTAVKNITYFDDGRTLVTLDNFYQPDSLVANAKIDDNDTFYIENAIELLDKEGEFYHNPDEGMVYYIPPVGINMALAEVYAPITEGLFKVSGSSISSRVHNISFENISFRHGTWTYPNDNSLVCVQAGSAYNSSASNGVYPPAQLTVEYADKIQIKNCEFKELGTNAVSYEEGVTNCVLEGNRITDVGGGAISIGKPTHNIKNISDDEVLCKNIDINNNYIRRTATQYRQMPAVTMYYGNGIRITNNDIADTAYSGISIGWGWGSANYRSPNTGRALVAGNHVSDVMRTLCDGANIYTLGYLPHTMIYANHFDCKYSVPAYFYPGIYLDEGTRYVSAVSNVITNCSKRWLFINSTEKSLDSDIYGNYTEGTEEENKSGSEIGENYTALTSMPSEAQAIISGAGLTAEYKHLSETENPVSSTFDLYYNTPSRYDEDGIYVEAISYTSGKVTARAEDYVSFNTGDYVNYTITVPDKNEYNFVLYSGSSQSSNTSVMVRISGANTDESFTATLVPSGKYGDYKPNTVCRSTLSAGTYNVWIKHIGGGGCHLNRLIVR